MMSSSAAISDLLPLFRKRIGSRNVLSTASELITYECDACTLLKHPPQLVVLPNNTADVAFIVQACIKAGIPYTARGAGTGLSGGALPVEGGVLIGLNRMNRLVAIDPENRTATVEVGVINAALNKAAQPHGLFYAPDPSSMAACSLGGNIAENAGGIHCIKYGVTTDHVLALEVVLPDGQVTWIGSSNRRVHGPNLLGLLVGSEGTLGIVTQALLKLTPLPEKVRVYLAAFDSLEAAGAAVSAIISSGLLPSALEFMDALTVRAVNQAFHVGFPESCEAVLLIELDGPEGQVIEDSAILDGLLQTHQAGQIRIGETINERAALWKARKATVAAYGRYLPAFYLHDCVIPRSRLVDILQKIQAVALKYDVTIANVFHAGDGNLHPHVLFDPANTEQVARAMAAGDEILHTCLSMGGALSGEHGIGLEKQAYMHLQFSPASLERMTAIKTVFDPQHLSNPGKIFPQRAGCGESRTRITAPVVKTNPHATEEGVWI
jgi:glycolate oxidase subunit GlcD